MTSEVELIRHLDGEVYKVTHTLEEKGSKGFLIRDMHFHYANHDIDDTNFHTRFLIDRQVEGIQLVVGTYCPDVYEI